MTVPGTVVRYWGPETLQNVREGMHARTRREGGPELRKRVDSEYGGYEGQEGRS